MRRLFLVALCGLLAGGGAGALAHKAPPRHHAVKKHHRPKHRRRKPVKKAVHRPATTTVPTVPDTATTPTDTTPATTTPASTDTTPVVTPPAEPVHALGVTARDAPAGGFVLSLSRTVLDAGSEVVDFHNFSQDGHDLRIDSAGGAQQAAWDELASLAGVTRTLPLSAGTYRVYCTLHLGMERQLTVQ